MGSQSLRLGIRSIPPCGESWQLTAKRAPEWDRSPRVPGKSRTAEYDEDIGSIPARAGERARRVLWSFPMRVDPARAGERR